MSAVKKMNDIYDFQAQLAEPWREGVQCQLVHSKTAGPEHDHSIGVGVALSPSDLLGLAVDRGFTHIVQQNSPHLQQDLNSSALMLLDEKKILVDPVGVILCPENGAGGNEHLIYSYNFSTARQKSEALGRFDDVLRAHSASGTLKAELLLIMDELFTNAVFNAPFVHATNMAGVSREDATVQMPQGKSARVFAGTDGHRIVVGCADPFGSLDLQRLLRRVKNCYDTNVSDNMNLTGPGGAGIGSYLVFNSSTSYFAAVLEGELTQICSVVPLKMSGRKRESLPKNLHWYSKGKE